MRNSGMKPHPGCVGSGIIALTLLVVAIFSAGCRTAPPLPPADLSSQGWQLRQGQAVWKPTRSRPELAGELLLATKTTGDFFVQFSKTPFTLATAQIADGQWQIEFGNGERRWKGHGKPPARFVWFQLPHALAGDELNHTWRFTRLSGDSWRLENIRTGESLEGGFFP
jgi:hypothetical protein